MLKAIEAFSKENKEIATESLGLMLSLLSLPYARKYTHSRMLGAADTQYYAGGMNLGPTFALRKELEKKNGAPLTRLVEVAVELLKGDKYEQEKLYLLCLPFVYILIHTTRPDGSRAVFSKTVSDLLCKTHGECQRPASNWETQHHVYCVCKGTARLRSAATPPLYQEKIRGISPRSHQEG